MIDLLIRDGTVVDGTGRAPYAADVAVENGKIIEVGQLPEAHARRVISARGKLVTPGFIDIHRHADLAAYRPGFGQPELRQGLTTIVNGNCGLSAAPIRRSRRAEIAAYLQPICGQMPAAVSTDSLAAYFENQPDSPLHTGMLVGAGVLRAGAAGYALERLEEKHYKAIHKAMEQALGDGALGVSLGLGYAPECFYTTEELMRALAPLAGQSIPVTVHMRQEGGGVLEALEEMLTVARKLRIPVHISHLKAMGRDNWGVKIPRALSMLEQARQEGLEVGCDAYPYTAGSTQLIHILPPDLLTGGMEAVVKRLQDKGVRRELAARIEDGGGFDDIAKLAGWDGIRLTSLHCPEDHPYQGKSIAEIAALWGQNPLDCCCDLLVREHCEITMVDFMASEEDIVTILQSPLSNVISDATYPTEGLLHPRVYGTFVHILEHFVRERGVLTVEQAIHKMTQKPAEVLHLPGKGVLAAGMDADINVFAPEKLHQPGTYENPCCLAEGMDYVLVDGAVAVEKGKCTGTKAGRILRR